MASTTIEIFFADGMRRLVNRYTICVEERVIMLRNDTFRVDYRLLYTK